MSAAKGYADELLGEGIRAEVSDTSETLPKRIRSAEVERIPYMVVIGEKEIADGSVSVRTRGEKGSRSASRAEFVARVVERARTRAFEP